MYSNNILNFQESTTILNACTKKVWELIEGITYVYIIEEKIDEPSFGYYKFISADISVKDTNFI